MNKKFKFISRDSKKQPSSVLKIEEDEDSYLIGPEIKFIPGQIVFLIENDRIIKKKVTQINITSRVRINGSDHSVEYALNDNNHKKYAEEKLFSKLEDIPIIDDSTEKIKRKLRRQYGDEDEDKHRPF